MWREDLGIGYLPTNNVVPYDEAYWEKYKSYANSEIADKLNEARNSFVKRYLHNEFQYNYNMCDVGIGNGQFVEANDCFGFDVNPKAVEWLKDRGAFANPNEVDFITLTFWDVLEHIEDHTSILRVENVFTSLPIHKDLDSLLNSKHLKPDEHLWHFTQEGVINFMNIYNYKVVEVNDSEIAAGREDIWSFYFKRNPL
jgi:hypothetical protein